MKKNKRPKPIPLTDAEKAKKIKAIPFTYGRKLTNLTTDEIQNLGASISTYVTLAKMRTASLLDAFLDLFNVHDIHQGDDMTVKSILIEQVILTVYLKELEISQNLKVIGFGLEKLMYLIAAKSAAETINLIQKLDERFDLNNRNNVTINRKVLEKIIMKQHNFQLQEFDTFLAKHDTANKNILELLASTISTVLTKESALMDFLNQRKQIKEQNRSQ
jgi:predicted Kef-type K+ transport protein